MWLAFGNTDLEQNFSKRDQTEEEKVIFADRGKETNILRH